MPRLVAGTADGNDVELHYEDCGSGSPVVLVHGWPLSGRSWENQVGPLVQAGHRVITYDRRGFGESSKPYSGYDYDTLSADLDALLSQLDLTGVTLVGFSMGGGEVVRYISQYGTSRVAKAVLASAVPPYLYKSDDNPDGGVDDDLAQQFTDGITGERMKFLDTFTQQFLSPGRGLTGEKVLVSEPTRQYLLQIAAFASPKATLDCVESFAMTDFRGDVEKITIPTLVIHGDSDQVVPFEVSGKRSHEAIAGSVLHVVEGGPHGINATHPDEFNRVLIDFLAS